TIFATQSPSLSISKTSTDTTYTTAGQTLHYSYKLTNNGNVTLAGPYTVTDDKASTSCPASPSSLAPGVSTTCTGTHPVTQGDLDFGAVTNTASAHGFFTYYLASSATTITSNTPTVTVTATQSPSLHLDKVAT